MIREQWITGRKTKTFVLQWHITHACPFSCQHCYDRSLRSEPTWPQAEGIVANFQQFCRQKSVQPQICLTGGDPLMYAHFWDLYVAIAKANVSVSILGNPISLVNIHRLMNISPPAYYQISLEGLPEQNDQIRGAGHYELAMQFLKAARSEGLNTHVMLTLTRDNLDQVLSLAQGLRGLTTRFTFNRLAQVGKGQRLDLPLVDAYQTFLRQYLQACQHNPVLGLKDNLINIVRQENALTPFPGCTGHGCGAAFNFVALLPDGEVHACRKFPSRLGNVHEQTLLKIYDSEDAKRYREGPEQCSSCPLNRVCRGCMAVTYGAGLDPLKARDPFCWISG